MGESCKRMALAQGGSVIVGATRTSLLKHRRKREESKSPVVAVGFKDVLIVCQLTSTAE